MINIRAGTTSGHVSRELLMLKVIGLGYPRTGTMSLKHALEQLGFGPCYHMIEVFNRPEDVAFWRDAIRGPVDWQEIFTDFQSTTDAPACHFWRQLFRQCPDARFVLTVRDADAWYDSFYTTVYQAMLHPERAPDEDHRIVQQMARELILDTMFGGRFGDREQAIEIYHQHNQEVAAAIPPDQLLVFDVAEGWGPLCRFLDMPVPAEPFPRSNTRVQFQERFSVPESAKSN
jgi:hypothetical protein